MFDIIAMCLQTNGEKMPWYVLMTKPQQEWRAEENLKNQGYITFLPVIDCHKISRGKKVVKVEPLFFRYIFVQLDLQKDNLSKIRYTRGVGDFIRFGNRFGTVSDELVQLLRDRCGIGGEIRSNLPQKGEEVEVLEGPYKHISAIYDCPDGDQRSIVLVTLLEKSVKLALKNSAFKKVV